MSCEGRRAVVGLRSWSILLCLAGTALLPSRAWPALSPRCTTSNTAGCCGIRSQDSFWIVSTRHLGCPRPQHADSSLFRYSRYRPELGCQPADVGQLLLDHRERTVIYVHGNRIESDEIFQRAFQAYHALTCGLDDPRSIRFIAWSWPSDQVCGLRRDALIKTARSDVESFYLAVLLAQLPPDTRLGLFGYSLGSRVISGALHLIGGGQWCGSRLPDPGPGFVEGPRIALMAAALDRSWWLSGRPHELCPAVAGAILVLYNPGDPVLRFYQRLNRQTRPIALGYTGFPWGSQLGPDAAKLQQMNVCCYVGRTHDEHRYFGSVAVMHQVRQCVLEP